MISREIFKPKFNFPSRLVATCCYIAPDLELISQFLHSLSILSCLMSIVHYTLGLPLVLSPSSGLSNRYYSVNQATKLRNLSSLYCLYYVKAYICISLLVIFCHDMFIIFQMIVVLPNICGGPCFTSL